MLIWLQNEFIPKLHVIVIFILIINQERVVVIKLLMKIMEKRKTKREQDRLLAALWRMGEHSFKQRGDIWTTELQRGSKRATNKLLPTDGFWPVGCCHVPT